MEHNENPDFDKGQHMLADVRIINREIEVAGLKKDDKVLEIGAGQGALTEALAGKCNVVAFEQDSRFKERLSAIEKRNDNLKIIYGDALSYSWMGYDKIVSNIPYLLSESILIKAVKSEVPEMVLIVGEKFKEKLFSDSKIGYIAARRYEIYPVCAVKKESFIPPPRTQSWLLHFKRRKVDKMEGFMLEVILGKGKVKNSIIRALLNRGKTKRQAKEIVAAIGLTEAVLNKPAVKMTLALIKRIENGLEDLKVF